MQKHKFKYNCWPADKFQNVSKPKLSAGSNHLAERIHIGNMRKLPEPCLPLLAAEVLLVFVVDSLQPRRGANGQPILRGSLASLSIIALIEIRK